MIQDNGIEWNANQRQFVRLAVTLTAPRVFADWASFKLTIREDPLWNERSARQLDTADPHTESWTVVASIDGAAESASVLLFEVTLPANAGENRYAFDVWGVGGVAGDSQLYPSTWLTLEPSTR